MKKFKALLPLIGVLSLTAPLASCNSAITLKSFTVGQKVKGTFVQPTLGPDTVDPDTDKTIAKDKKFNFSVDITIGETKTETYSAEEDGTTQVCHIETDAAGEFEVCEYIERTVESVTIGTMSLSSDAVITKDVNYAISNGFGGTYVYTKELIDLVNQDAVKIVNSFVGRTIYDIVGDVTWKTNVAGSTSNKANFEDPELTNPSYSIAGHSLNDIIQFTEDDLQAKNFAARERFDTIVLTGITIAVTNALIK